MSQTNRNKKEGTINDPESDSVNLVNESNSIAGEESGLDHEVEDDDELGNRKPPWHFKGFIVISIIYLGYRTYQGIEWLLHHIK